MKPALPSAPAGRRPLSISLGAGRAIDTGLPVLAGEAVEELFGDVPPSGRLGPLSLFQAGGWLLGAATDPMEAGLEEAAHRLYGAVLGAARGWHLARVWNYVPAINAPGPGGLENYRGFCRARSRAFEEAYGGGFKSRLPSSSAVGTKADGLTVVFAACPAPPLHVENPLQVPAYDYPGDYGPRAPSFARATVVPGQGGATVFISGTAAIRGHATVAPHRTRPQLECALEILGSISHACGLGPDLDRGGASSRHFKVYLRDPAELPSVAATLQERLLTQGDRVSYLHADVCRDALQVEIEATLFGAALRPR